MFCNHDQNQLSYTMIFDHVTDGYGLGVFKSQVK